MDENTIDVLVGTMHIILAEEQRGIEADSLLRGIQSTARDVLDDLEAGLWADAVNGALQTAISFGQWQVFAGEV